jgi:hypothetical protein
MKKYTTYGNCQADSLAKFLNSNKDFSSIYKYEFIGLPWKMTRDQIVQALNNILPYVDLFIYQPYLNFDLEYTTQYITEKILKKDCIRIVFPSVHFSAYHPQTTAFTVDNTLFSGFTVNHDYNLIKKYLSSGADINIDIFINEINKEDYYDEKTCYSMSIKILRR